MANPYLPNWEYIPDGEPRVFGDRIYVYGSHDRKDSIDFCDYKLKVWSAPVSDPTKWVCHGDIFRSRDGHDSPSDVDWTDELLFAPDVVERGGKYYLYAYIVNAKGCVAVADRPEGPFRLLSRYEYDIPNHYDNGTFIDPGVLVDDDGRVYIYCGYQGSYMCELKDNMYEAVPGSYKLDIIPTAEPHRFFEACSPRKINGTYYLIYSPQRGSCLDYAISDSPTGPFTYRGTIIDNGIDFPGGNDHGSVCCVNGQWYIFYHRMTNGTIMSRRGCVERIEILPDGTIPQVEMTSLGFEESLNPYDFTQADTACVLKGGCYITETSVFERPIVNVTDGCVMGWKYFDFGEDFASKTMQIRLKLRGTGSRGRVHVRLDSEDGEELGTVDFAEDSGTAGARIKAATGRHAVFLVAESGYEGWFAGEMKGRQLFMLDGFVIMK
ncbi:MAG TPA: xylan 1,4-beta-xylosidase [Ruminococcaceae bacterium]|nr:xylan 1,4-beta-xylosidase [Oscillospiraceae bacterium]HCK49372.1 xylan 1,4-beta-xylosidase [Oscillospiraceae bacterium]